MISMKADQVVCIRSKEEVIAREFGIVDGCTRSIDLAYSRGLPDD